MKVWEEKWEANVGDLLADGQTRRFCILLKGPQCKGGATDEEVGDFCSEARANLAAQAPKMARALYSLYREVGMSERRLIEIETILRNAGVIQ